MLNRDKHRLIMFQILKDIFSSEIWKCLAFKWWTACYFLYWLDRFSTDLDFDLVENIPDLDEKIIKIISKYWQIKAKNKIILSFWENLINIKIDVNRKIWKANKYDYVDFFWTMIKVQNKETIFANKLVALLERFINRDIYDVYFFFKNFFDINEKVIFERTWLSLNELFKKIIEKLDKLPKNYKILDWLWELLDEKQKDFVKNKLISELKNILQFKII